MEAMLHKTITATGGAGISVAAYAGPCLYGGFLLGMDSLNDQTVTVYNNAAEAAGHEPSPTNQYDASVFGMNGHDLSNPTPCDGIFLVVVGSGAVDVTVYFKPDLFRKS